MFAPYAFPEATRNALRRFRRGEISLRLPVINLCVALWLITLVNVPFWRALWHATAGWDASHAGYLLSLPVFVLIWVWLLLECLTWGRAAKLVLALVLLLSAGAAYFMSTYAIVFDRDMIVNIVGTDKAEALELLSPRLVGWLLVFAGVPIWLLSRVHINRRRWRLQLLDKAMTFGMLISGVVIIIALFFQSYAPLLRNHRELLANLVPSNYVAAVQSYIREKLATADKLELVALDATRRATARTASKLTLTVLVIGETARAANFALDGYARPTNPELAAEADLINFRQVRSCGTSTAVSLPCLFLDVGRAGFSDTLAARRENLLDVLQRVGYAVLWRDNNAGCKGLCDRVHVDDLTRLHVPDLCEADECYDEILLHGLQEKLDAFDRDAVVVLHMKGSHGPAYYLRYPAAFKFFTPVCETNQFDRCQRETIVNAYDNTLRYTDHVLARTLELLRRNANRFDASLIYVSDHGESLGENGFYLHGMPYAIAPTEQTHIPMLMWISRGAQLRFGIDAACLRRRQDEALSHDNLYHSTLGLLEVQTRIYRADRDLFHDCRTAQNPMVAASPTTPSPQPSLISKHHAHNIGATMTQ